MASVGNINPLFSTSQTQTGTTRSNSSGSGSGADPLANESTFLQLLVAQLKNQNPASPMDGTTFVTQLAQFSDLEQNLAMRQDLDAISSKYDGSTSGQTSATQTGSSQGTTGSTSGTTQPKV